MKQILCLFISIIFLIGNAYSTAQYPDRIIFQDKEYDLHSNPLEAYFEKYPDKRPKGGIMSTALWRGYVATFIVTDNELYLEDIKIEIPNKNEQDAYQTKWKSVINEFNTNTNKLKIDWQTGILVIPYGKLKNYVHMGYASTYSKYILLEIKYGEIQKRKKLKYKQYVKFKAKQFERFKTTAKYKEVFDDLKSQMGYEDKFIEEFLKDFVIEYTSKFLD